jgi:hypothetical protein
MWLTVSGLLAVASAPALAEGAPDPAACRAPVSLDFRGQPSARSLQEAVRWTITTVARSDGMPIAIRRLPEASVIYFADGTWTGASPVPSGVADAVVWGFLTAPGPSAPDPFLPRRSAHVLLPKEAPSQVATMDSGRVWVRYVCSLDHASFALGLDDGSVVRSDDATLYVEVWKYGPTDWRPRGLRVIGGFLESGPAPQTTATVNDSALAAATLPLAIRPLRDAASGVLAFDVTLPRRGGARLDLFDLQGRRIAEWQISGAALEQRVSIGRRLSAGVYWARLAQGPQSVTRKVAVR